MTPSALARLGELVEERLSGVDRGRLARDAVRLSDAFTAGRADLPPRYLDDPELLRAYISLFLPINAAKIVHCLGEARDLGLIPSGRPLRILDVGCGPGTAAIAASLFFSECDPGRRLEITGFDRSAAALEEARTLFSRLGTAHHSFRSEAADIVDRRLARLLEGSRFDLIIAANVLNELGDEEKAFRICRDFVEDHLADGGLFIVIDPALKETARSLMKLRDDLLVCADIDVAAPCLHRRPCPMRFANARDWCHYYIEWKRPEIVRELDELTGLDHRHLKMAYVVFRHSERSEESPRKHEILRGACPERSRRAQDDSRRVSRVVSSPLVSKGKRELVLCGSDGILRRVMRQDKDATEANESFECAGRGDVVVASGEARIGKAAPFCIVSAWGRL